MQTFADTTKITASPAANLQLGKNDVHAKEHEIKLQESLFFQPKLTVGSANDPLEKEADATADKVTQMPMSESIIFSVGKNSVQRKCAHCEEEEKQLQKKESSGVSTSVAPPIVHDVLSSGGKSLDTDTRSFMEPRFNYDFSNVKIHNNELAAKSANSINALAYTSGNNVVFNSGQFDANSDSGRRLLTHELTHVVQQGNSPNKIQRQADIRQAPTGMPCVLTTGPGHLAGVNIMFTKESATLSPAALLSIRSFAGSWSSGGGTADVFVDGYSSVDGPQTLNWQLSCDRAETVKRELISNGVTDSKILTSAHGESTEFSRTQLTPNRRAIIASINVPQPSQEEPPVCGSPPTCPTGGAAPFLRNPHIASGSECRGACGSNCPPSCTTEPDVALCITDSSGNCHYTCTYQSVIQCGSHQGCRDHDDCYDRCAAGGETSLFGLCHRGCDLTCINDHNFSDCNSWRTGGGPFDRMLLFSDPPSVSGPFPGSCTP